MRKLVKRTGTLLVAGILLNAIVVLIIAATVNVYDAIATGGMQSLDGVHWQVQRSRHFGADRVISLESPENTGTTQVKPQEMIPAWLDLEPPTAEGFRGIEQSQETFLGTGWPMRCVWCQGHSVSLLTDSTVVKSDVTGGLTLPLDPFTTMGGRSRPRIVPLRPIWTGMAVNVLTFALLAGAIGLLFDGTKELRRFRRGRCPSCRYDLRHDYSSGCSECGWKP